MSNEKLTKKLALFHHPLFQSSCLKWRDCIGPNQTSLNLITFAEINIRIQKTIMSSFNFENAFFSALNDWQQEVETLSSQTTNQVQSPQKKSAHSKQKKEQELKATFTKMLNEIPFEAGLTNDAYLDLFSNARHHEAFNFVKDHISLSGFFKFLFDLGYSFCEELDVELFCLLLNGIFLQTTTVDLMGQRSLQNIKSITCLPSAFMTQHKLLKAHYDRYRKIGLGDYDKWYEWNYLPARINEMKTKAKEVFLQCFPSDQNISPFLDELYDNSVSKIIQSDLVMPTLRHFIPQHGPQNPGEYSMESLFSLNPQTIDHDTFIPLERSPNNQRNAHQKVSKKLTLPIFGKTIPKPAPVEEKIRTHTIKSLTTFIDPTEDVSRIEPTQGLGPIWENELSETNSTDSRTNFYQPKYQDFIDDDSFSVATKRKLDNVPKYPAVSASMNFDQSKTINQSDITNEDTHSGFMTGVGSYQIIKPNRDGSNTTNSSTIIKAPPYPPDANPPRNRPLRALAKIEEIASASQRQNSAKQRGFGVFGVNPNGLVDLLEDNRPSSMNIQKKKDSNRHTPQGGSNSEPRKGILRGASQNGYRKSGLEDLTLFGRSTSQVVDTGSLSSLNTSPDHKPESREIILPVIEAARPNHVSFKKPSYHGNSAERQKSFNLYENVQFAGPDQAVPRVRNRSSFSGRIPAFKIEKPKPEAANFVWQVKENFDEKQREEFFEKMQVRQEKNKKRQENRSKSNSKKKNRREKSNDIGARTKVFLNTQNRSLYKEVFM